MNAPLVTISIPIYNCEKHLTNCLQSVVNQEYKNFEIQLVDDWEMTTACKWQKVL